MESNLLWNESLQIDESIEKTDYHGYDPQTGTDLNESGDIRIIIQNQDQFLLPSKSYLYIEGVLKQKDGNKYADDECEVSLINNGLMYSLFDRVSYQISNQEVEGYSYPGRATTMKNLLTYPRNYSEGMNFLWSPDTLDSVADNDGFAERCTYLLKQSESNAGNFSATIPLSHIFGFCENYDKVIYGVKHELILRRTGEDDEAIYKSDEVVGGNPKVKDGKVVLTRLSWRMPFVIPADSYKLKLFKQIENRSALTVGYLNRQCESINVPPGTRLDWRLSVTAGAEKPRYVIVGLQNDRYNKQTKNTGLFDHCNISNGYVSLNSERYPKDNLQLDYLNNIYTRSYKMLCEYFNNVLGKECCPIKISEYKNVYPLLVFDVSKQSERLKNTVIDIKIQLTFRKNIGKDVIAYALILSDRIIKLQSDGEKMNVVY